MAHSAQLPAICFLGGCCITPSIGGLNVLGCLVIGVLAGLAVKENFFSFEARLFLFTGIVGGFTTFSAFGLETFYLLRRAEFLVAGSYVLLSIVVGLFALWVGFSVAPHRS